MFETPRRLFAKIRKAWRNQPEITVFRPFRIPEDPEPTPFELIMQGRTFKGFILRQDPQAGPRELNKRGNSHSLTVPPLFVKHLKKFNRPFLVQIQDQVGLIVLPCTETGETLWHQELENGD